MVGLSSYEVSLVLRFLMDLGEAVREDFRHLARDEYRMRATQSFFGSYDA